jgi:hypothetical protein
MAQVAVTGRLTTNPNRFFKGEMSKFGKHIYDAHITLDDASVAKLTKARQEAIETIWEGKPMPSHVNDYVIREGDDPEYSNTYGKKFIIAKKQDRAPTVIRKQAGKTVAVTSEEGLFYAGCQVALSIDVYGSKGDKAEKIPAYLTVGLRSVMFLRDDEPLGDRVDADSEFGDQPDSEVEVAEDF